MITLLQVRGQEVMLENLKDNRPLDEEQHSDGRPSYRTFSRQELNDKQTLNAQLFLTVTS